MYKFIYFIEYTIQYTKNTDRLYFNTVTSHIGYVFGIGLHCVALKLVSDTEVCNQIKLYYYLIILPIYASHNDDVTDRMFIFDNLIHDATLRYIELQSEFRYDNLVK